MWLRRKCGHWSEGPNGSIAAARALKTLLLVRCVQEDGVVRENVYVQWLKILKATIDDVVEGAGDLEVIDLRPIKYCLFPVFDFATTNPDHPTSPLSCCTASVCCQPCGAFPSKLSTEDCRGTTHAAYRHIMATHQAQLAFRAARPPS